MGVFDLISLFQPCFVVIPEKEKKKAIRSSPNFFYLPDDVLTEEILLRVAVKDLLRWRCVSKSWRAIISHPDFVRKRLQRSISSPSTKDVGLVVKDHSQDGSRGIIRTLDLNYFDRPPTPRLEGDRIFRPFFFFKLKKYLGGGRGRGHSFDNIVGSCNGLVCLSSSYASPSGGCRVAIWNPSTGKSHELPGLPTEARSSEHELHLHPSPLIKGRLDYGFGHDCHSDDYKVMVLEQIYSNQRAYYCTLLRVYSLRTKTWTTPLLSSKNQQRTPHDKLGKYLGFFASAGGIGNALHWILAKHPTMTSSRECYIGAFDLGGGNGHHEVPLPNFHEAYGNYDHYPVVAINLCVLGGCLCFCSSSAKHSSTTDIWVMKEYGVKESWTRLISFGDAYVVKVPLAYSRCGGKVLLHDHSTSKLTWYDLKTKTITEVERHTDHSYSSVETCVHSLVDPDAP